MTLPLFTWCEICGSPDGILTTRKNQANGLPQGVRACQDCRDAVTRREVGVTVQPGGALSVTDGRKWA